MKKDRERFLTLNALLDAGSGKVNSQDGAPVPLVEVTKEYDNSVSPKDVKWMVSVNALNVRAAADRCFQHAHNFSPATHRCFDQSQQQTFLFFGHASATLMLWRPSVKPQDTPNLSVGVLHD